MNNKIKAIFFDIDGTLVGFKSQSISDYSLRALDELRKKGIKLFIATGRSKPLITNLKSYPFDAYITMNGSLVYYNNEVIYSHPITKESSYNIAELCEEKGLSCVAFTKDSLYINFENQRSTEINRLLNIGGFIKCNMSELAQNEDVFQYTIYVDEQEQEQYFADKDYNIEWHRWHEGMGDAIPKGISKAVGLRLIMQKLNLSKDECIAFGDGGNDYEMFKELELSVAMADASDKLKSVASYVTDSPENEGVVKALKRFGLLDSDF